MPSNPKARSPDVKNTWYNTKTWENLGNDLYDQYPNLYKRMVDIILGTKSTKVMISSTK